MLTAIPAAGGALVMQSMVMILLSHMRIYGRSGATYVIDERLANSKPSILTMVLAFFAGTLGIASLMLGGGGSLPFVVIDLQEDPSQMLSLYLVSSTIPVAVNFPLWLLATTGATCNHPGIGRYNIGKLISLLLSGSLGFIGIVHYGSTFAEMASVGELVKVSMIILPVIAVSGSVFTAFLIRNYFFSERLMWHAKNSARFFIEEWPKMRQRRRDRKGLF